MPFWNHVIANEPTGFARCFKESTTIAIGSLEDVFIQLVKVQITQLQFGLAAWAVLMIHVIKDY